MSDIVERLRRLADESYDAGFRVGVEKAPSYKENQELRDEIERLRLMLGSLLDVTAGRMTDTEIKDAYGMIGWDVIRRAREER
jgi:hypothetical protein